MQLLTLIVLLATTPGAMPPHQKVQPRVLTPKKHAPAAKTAPRKAGFPAVELFAVNLHERLLLRPYDDKGRPRKTVAQELTRFLRCWHTGKTHKVDPRLARVVYQLGRHYAGRRIEVYSGFRPRKYCTRPHSRHLTASAIDFRIPGVRNEEVINWLRQTFHPAGVGYYPNGVHVHLDVDRVRDTYWIDTGDAPTHDHAPLAAVGDTAPAQIEATADEPVELAAAPEDSLPPPPEVDPILGN